MRAIRGITHYFKRAYQIMANRRKDERLPVAGTVNATWKNQYGQLVTCTCKTLNLSPHGVAVLSEEPATPSADAYLYSSGHRLKSFAAVRYCTRTGAGYRIGFQFRAVPAVWDGY